MSHLLFFRTGCCTYIVNVGNVFDRGVYVGKNSSQAASVEFVRSRRTNYARSRLQKTGGKARRGFSTSSEQGHPKVALFSVNLRCGWSVFGCLVLTFML